MEDSITTVVCLLETRTSLEGFGMFIKLIFVELNIFNAVVSATSLVVLAMDFTDGEGLTDARKKAGEPWFGAAPVAEVYTWTQAEYKMKHLGTKKRRVTPKVSAVRSTDFSIDILRVTVGLLL